MSVLPRPALPDAAHEQRLAWNALCREWMKFLGDSQQSGTHLHRALLQTCRLKLDELKRIDVPLVNADVQDALRLVELRLLYEECLVTARQDQQWEDVGLKLKQAAAALQELLSSKAQLYQDAGACVVFDIYCLWLEAGWQLQQHATVSEALLQCKTITDTAEIRSDLRAEMLQKLLALHLEYAAAALRSRDAAAAASDLGADGGPRELLSEAERLACALSSQHPDCADKARAASVQITHLSILAQIAAAEAARVDQQRAACISEASRLHKLLPLEADGASVLRHLIALSEETSTAAFDEGALVAFVSREGATASMCASAIERYATSGHVAAAITAVAAALPRFGADAGDIVECMLQFQPSTEPDEALLCALLDDGSVRGALQQQRTSCVHDVRTVLTRHAGRLSQEGQHARADRFLRLAMSYAEGHERPLLLRKLAINALAAGRLNDGLAAIDESLALMRGLQATGERDHVAESPALLLRFKLLMQRGDQGQALEALGELVQCPAFDPTLLTAIALDAIKGCAGSIGHAVMRRIYEMTLPNGDEPAAVDIERLKLSRAELLRNMVMLRAQSLDTLECVKWDHIAVAQDLEAVAVVLLEAERFVRSEPLTAFAPTHALAAELDWLAAATWGAAARATELRLPLQATLLFRAVATFNGLHPTPHSLVRGRSTRSALVAAATMALHVYEQESTAGEAAQASKALTLAESSLEKASAEAAKLRAELRYVESPEDTAANGQERRLAFRLALISDDQERMTSVVHAIAPTSGVSAQDLMCMATGAKESHPAVSLELANKALHMLSADYWNASVAAQMGEILTFMLHCAPGHSQQLQILQNAAGLLEGRAGGGAAVFPEHHVYHLVSTAFNMACEFANFKQKQLAREFLSAALRISRASGCESVTSEFLERQMNCVAADMCDVASVS